MNHTEIILKTVLSHITTACSRLDTLMEKDYPAAALLWIDAAILETKVRNLLEYEQAKSLERKEPA